MTRTCCLQPWNSTNSSCTVVFFRFLFCHQIICVSVNFRNATSKFKERSRVWERCGQKMRKTGYHLSRFARFGSVLLIMTRQQDTYKHVTSESECGRSTSCVWMGPFAVDFDGQFQRPPLFFLRCLFHFLFHFWFCWCRCSPIVVCGCWWHSRARSIIQNQGSRETEKKRNAIYPKNRHAKRQNKSNR